MYTEVYYRNCISYTIKRNIYYAYNLRWNNIIEGVENIF